MPDSVSAQSEHDDLLQTRHIAAEKAISILRSDETTGSERLLALGDYVICCSLAKTKTGSLLVDIREGLIEAGATPDGVDRLAEWIAKYENHRNIFDLSYAGGTSGVSGIVRGRYANQKTYRTLRVDKFVKRIRS